MPHKKFQLYRPLKNRFFEVLYCNFNREIGPKMIIGHNFWLGSQVRYPWKDLAKCCSDARGKSKNIFWGGPTYWNLTNSKWATCIWRLSFRQMERRSTCMSAGRKTLAHLLLHPSALVFLMRFEETLPKYKPFHGRCWAVERCTNVRVGNWNLTISLIYKWKGDRCTDWA